MKTAVAFLSIAVVILLVATVYQNAVIQNQRETIRMLFNGCEPIQ